MASDVPEPGEVPERGFARPPIVVLSGSDRRPVELPETGRDLHPLSGYKGVDLRIDGVPIICRVVEQLRRSERFCQVYVAGPARVLAGVVRDAELIDVDASVGENVRRAVETVRRRHPGCAIAFTACDVLPDAEALRAIMDGYADCVPCDVFYPLVKVPKERGELGASSWKPTYAVAEEPGGEPVAVLPGHLVIADPGALRLSFVYRLLNLTYRTRNRPLQYRRNVMIRGLIFELLLQDLRHLLTLRPPTLTVSVIVTGLQVVIGLRDRTISRVELERRARKVFVTSRHRRLHPERRVVLPLIEHLALALDIDTVEEARHVGADMHHPSETGERA